MDECRAKSVYLIRGLIMSQVGQPDDLTVAIDARANDVNGLARGVLARYYIPGSDSPFAKRTARRTRQLLIFPPGRGRRQGRDQPNRTRLWIGDGREMAWG